MIDELQNGQPAGRIHSCHFAEELPFYGLSQLIFTLNEICAALSWPRCEFQLRSFAPAGDRQTPEVMEERLERESALRQTAELVYPRQVAPGGLCAFSVDILYRRHGSFQGSVTVLGKKPPVSLSFRSSLELEYLIAEVAGILPQPLEPSGRGAPAH